MSFKVSFAAADLDYQVELLKLYPEIANKHFYPAMHRAVSGLKGAIEPNIPFKSGASRAAFDSKVSGRGLNIQARVGWFGAGMPWYINIQEYGAPEHDVGYVPSLGVQILAVSTPALHFMQNGFERSEPMIEDEMTMAMLNSVRDLEVK